jgi:NO-binding membrane sensor protein with MHYT domain
MHFVAMLAFSLGMPIDYQVGATVASLVAAILVAGTALYVVGRWNASWKSLLIAGTFAGLGVATMHYMGMAAMQMDATISYDPTLFGASIVIAVVAATAALWLSTSRPPGTRWPPPSSWAPPSAACTTPAWPPPSSRRSPAVR